MEIREIAGGYRIATKPEYHDAVRAFVKSLKPPMKLSLQALETLAVIAYKQPVTAPEVSEIRGVDSSGVLGSLVSRKLITTAGRKQVIGRPILYKTTKEFLLRFGLKDLNELPIIEEFEKMAGESKSAKMSAPAEAELPPCRARGRQAKRRSKHGTGCLSGGLDPDDGRDQGNAASPHPRSRQRRARQRKIMPISQRAKLSAEVKPIQHGRRREATASRRSQPARRDLDAAEDRRSLTKDRRSRERLQKIIAAAGVTSRRKAEELHSRRTRAGQRPDRHRTRHQGRCRPRSHSRRRQAAAGRRAACATRSQ